MYTTTLRDHDVKGRGYMECTDEAYRQLIDPPAWQLRQQRSLPKGTNLRDKMYIVELSATKLAEALATQRIPAAPEPSTISDKTVADFTRVVELTGISNQAAWARNFQ